MKLRLKLKWKKQAEAEEADFERSELYDGKEWVRGRVIGEGGFGRVNLAHFRGDGKQFKGMPAVAAAKSCLMSSSCCDDLMKEKLILDRLRDCPYIVRCLGSDVTFDSNGGDEERRLNVFLEYAAKGSLLDGMRGPLAEAEAGRVTRCVAAALERVHAEGLVHCDVKLDNVLVFHDDVAKLADFGLARPAEEGVPGNVCGTLPYWAPEMVTAGGVQGQASDVWALGWVALGLLTGTEPWAHRESLCDQQLAAAIAAESPLPLHLRGVFSNAAEDFLCQCFRRDPKKRPTAAELLAHPFLRPPIRLRIKLPRVIPPTPLNKKRLRVKLPPPRRPTDDIEQPLKKRLRVKLPRPLIIVD